MMKMASPPPLPERPTDARYRQLVDAVSEVVFLTDSAGKWQLLNPPWTSLTGYSVAESLERPAFEVIHPDERESLRAEIGEVLRSGKPLTRRLRLLTKSGRTRWIDIGVGPSLDPSGRIDGAAGTIRDVTASQLRRALEEASRTVDRHILDDRRTGSTLQRVCDDLARDMSYPLVAITLADRNAGGPLVAPAGSAVDQPGGLVLRWDDPEVATGPIGTARLTRQTQTCSMAGPPGSVA